MTSVVEKIGFSETQANILNVLGKYSLLITQLPMINQSINQ